MEEETIRELSSKLEKAISAKDEAKLRTYSAALISGIAPKNKTLISTIDKLANDTGDDLVQDAMNIYSTAAMQILLIGASLV